MSSLRVPVSPRIRTAASAPATSSCFCVQHLWLCGTCSEKYTLAYEDTRGVVMTLQHMDLLEERDACRFVAVT